MRDARVTHLHRYHRATGHMTIFAGFEMPVWYQGISAEHMAVRNSAGLFDVSHMGRFEINGRNTTTFLNHLLPTDVDKVQNGRAFYTTICNEKGGIIDDTIVYRFANDSFLLVSNAANREKDFSWLQRHSDSFEIRLSDLSDSIAMLALQGPKSEDLLQRSCEYSLRLLKRFSHIKTRVARIDCIISRTGYTGEDGFEILVPKCLLDDAWKAEKIWNEILSGEGTMPAVPCGLGARDTLRLEAGYCLYGQDIDEATNPFEADLAWVVSPEKGEFIGREALVTAKDKGISSIRRGFIIRSAGVPRSGFDVVSNRRRIGSVTSGTFSPLLRKGIAMGYVETSFAQPGTEVGIQIRDKSHEGDVRNFPLYDTQKYGWKRSPN